MPLGEKKIVKFDYNYYNFNEIKKNFDSIVQSSLTFYCLTLGAPQQLLTIWLRFGLSDLTSKQALVFRTRYLGK